MLKQHEQFLKYFGYVLLIWENSSYIMNETIVECLPPQVMLEMNRVLKQLSPSHRALVELKVYADTIIQKLYFCYPENGGFQAYFVYHGLIRPISA